MRLTTQIRGGLSDFQGAAVEMKHLGSMAELNNAEVATAAVTEENIEISVHVSIVEVDGHVSQITNGT